MRNAKNLLPVILLGLVFVGLSGCSKDEDFLKLADDILPIDSFDHSTSTESSIDKILVCQKKESCLISEDQVYRGGAILYNDDYGNLYVDFNLEAGYKIKAIYLFVGIHQKQLPYYKGGGAAFENYPFIKKFDQATVQSYTYKIELGEDDLCYYVSAKLDIIKDGSSEEKAVHLGCTSNSKTADAFYVDRNIINGLYIGYCYKTCTPVDYTFAFEDVKLANSNDMDYNDLVIQARYLEALQGENQVTNISMVFYAKARGAGYDHEFSVKVPVKGASQVAISRYNAVGALLSQEKYNRSGTVNCIVFPSTQEALPANSNSTWYASNTDTARSVDGTPPCLVRSWKTVVSISLDNPTLNISGQSLNKPYDPYILVKPFGTDPQTYEIHIHQISNNPIDLFELNGKSYPYGLIVPSNWAWPLERISILDVYPSFPDGLWYDTMSPDAPGFFKETLFGPPCF